MRALCICPIGKDRWWWCDCDCEHCLDNCPRAAELPDDDYGQMTGDEVAHG
jgi:hypothetical protein